MARLPVTVLCASLLVFAACGTDDDVESSAGETTTTVTVDSSTEDVTTSTTTEADTEDDAAATESDVETESGSEDDPEVGTEDDVTVDNPSEDDAGTGGEGDGSNPEFCAAGDELESIFDDLEQDSAKGFIEAIEGADDKFEAYVEAAPDELRDEAETLVGAVGDLSDELSKLDPDAPEALQAIEDETTRAFAAPGVSEATTAIDEYTSATCGDS